MKRKKFSLLVLSLISVLSLKAQQWGDYTLYSVMGTTTAYLIDTNSNTFHTWSGLTGATGYSGYLMPGGILWRTVNHNGNSFNGGGMTGEVQKVAYDGTLLWDYVCSSTTYCCHHDICPMPNGDVLIISYESKTTTEVTQAGSSVSHIMWPDKVIEVQPSGATTGNIVWEWHAWDHLVQHYDASKDNYGVVADHPELLNINYNNTANISDWMHTNGIDYNPTLDQIVISAHNMNELYVIDHSTTTAEAASHSGGNSGHGGDFLYRWGSPTAYGASGTADFNVVHDAHWVPAGCPHANYLAGFNNNGISMNQSCVDLINPPYNGYNYTYVSGQAYAPASYSWRHACSGHTSDLGNSQQLPNGNTLVCIAMSGKIYEIDSNQNIIWTKTVSGTVPQAFRYTACYVSGTQPAPPAVSQNGNSLSSSAGTTYQWYLNGILISGATTQNYTPLADGNYQVVITDANGCASDLSTGFAFTVSGIDGPVISSSPDIYPNPTTGMLNLQTSSSALKNKITVYTIYGREVIEKENTNSIDLSALDNGIYFISVSDVNGQLLNKKITLIH